MTAQAKLRTEDVLALLASRRQSASEHSIPSSRRRAFRQAAAVLAGVRDIEKLQPVGAAGTPGEAKRVLKDDFISVPGPKFDGTWMLAPALRRAALRELGSRSAIQDALGANPKERTGRIQAQFERYLLGDPAPIESQSLAELEDTLQVLLWIGDLFEGLPSLQQVSRRIEYLRLLVPFESLAGDAVFRGRRTEMDKLRRYIGVIPPEALLARLSDFATGWKKAAVLPALSVYGPGGVGKSALIARFMLEHTRVAREIRLPFAYLDFDQPSLDISNPITLCGEMARQLHLQFPEEVGFDRLNAFLAGHLADQQRADAKAQSPDDRLSSVRSILSDLLGGLQQRLGPRPYIVALDTFEEVQYRSESRALPFWGVLRDMQQRWPFLRVVISGRAPVKSLMLAGQPPIEQELGELDKPAAIAFLAAQGVTEPALASQIVDRFGGVPLSLKLAASLLDGAGGAQDELKQVAGKSTFWFSASDELIQGHLYERILSHIHDPRVERLAHPGLVLRRITPAVILNVLNGPCVLALDNMNEAEILFEELKRETALVTYDDLDGALVHRADLRRVMLKLLTEKAPAQVEDIRRAAIAWYSTQSGRRARAEELYHRLQLGEAIEKTDIADPEIRSSLQASISELPMDAQLQLASFGLEVAAEVLKHASQEQTEAHIAAQVEELLAYGDSALDELHAITTEFTRRLDHMSVLFRAAARCAMQEQKNATALSWIEQGLNHAVGASNTAQILDLLSEKAWCLRTTPTDELSRTLDALGEYGARHRRRTALVQHRIQSLELGQLASSPGGAVAPKELARMLGELQPLELWGLVPVLEGVLEPLVSTQPELPFVLGPILLHEESPFRRASFAESRPQEALEALLEGAYGNWSHRSIGPHGQFLRLFRGLCQAWPYRLLHVQPPYGLGISELSESMA